MTKQHYEKLGYVFTKYRDPFYVKPYDLPRTSGVKIHVKCDRCGEDSCMTAQAYHARLQSNDGYYYCRKCGKQNYWKTKMDNGLAKQQMARFYDFCAANNYTPLSSIEDYKGVSSNLKYKCPKHGIQTIYYSQAVSGVRCRHCGYENIRQKNRTPISEVKHYFEDIDVQWINPGEYINSKTNNMQIKCPNCNKTFVTSYALFKRSLKTCTDCAYKIRHVANKYTIEDVARISNQMGVQILNIEDYVNSSTQNLKIKCTGCKQVELIKSFSYILKGFTNCPNCYPASRGQEYIEKVLGKYKIEHVRQKKFFDCVDKRVLPFDFYLPYYNTVIEFDGKHHFEPVFSLQDYLTCVKHDNIKNLYCEKKGITIIRIPYTKINQIESILVQQLQIPT